MPSTNLTTTVFVVRQPIFHRAKNVHGYELLFRSGRENRYDGTDGDACTLDVIANSFATIGLDELTAGHRGFINFTRNLLLQDVVNLLPPDQVTVEVLENINPDEEVLAACRRLKDAGYTLALDDFVLTDPNHPLLDLADIVKIDFMATPREEQKRVVDVLNGRKIKALAEKVETDEEFRRAEADGYTYFQGYFFAKPSICEGKDRLGEQTGAPEAPGADEPAGDLRRRDRRDYQTGRGADVQTAAVHQLGVVRPQAQDLVDPARPRLAGAERSPEVVRPDLAPRHGNRQTE